MNYLPCVLIPFSVQSPSEFLNKKPPPPQPSVLGRRQSIAVVEGLTNDRVFPPHVHSASPTPPPPHLLERKCSLQVTGVGEGQSLVDAMSARSSPGLADVAMNNNRDAHVRSVRYIHESIVLCKWVFLPG